MTSQDRKTRSVAKRQAARPGTERPEAEKPRAARPQVARPEAAKLEIEYAPIMKALGTAGIDFLMGLLGQISNAGSQGRDPVGVNVMLAVIKGVNPREQIEAMISGQMAAYNMTHSAL